MARYSKEHRARTRDRIVDVAARALREKGFDGFGVAEVMGAAGLTHGGFYAHFDSKQDLLEAALAKALTQSPGNFHKLVQAATHYHDPAILANNYLADSKIDNIAGGCATAALASELHRQPAPIGSTFAAGSEATISVIRTMPGLEHNSWAALAMLVGAKSIMRAITDAPMRDIIRSEVADAIRKIAAGDYCATPDSPPHQQA
jgi:TetR/AcrR family transcriptional regulator, transcriptional repressor for nem operon